jgi:hypothetical protein
MAPEELLKKGPASRLREKLFGDLAELSDEELDALYKSVAPQGQPAATVQELALQAASRYRKRGKLPPAHVQACQKSPLANTLESATTPVLEEIVEALSPSVPRPAADTVPSPIRKSVTETDKKRIGELAEELNAEGGLKLSQSPAAQLARILLERFGIVGKPDLEAICCLLGLHVREKAFDGFDGILIRRESTQRGIIGVNASIQEPSHKRFTVAHEIGHFIIPYHRQIERICEPELIESFSRNLVTTEMEANDFAMELLLPGAIMRRVFDLDGPSLSRISSVADEFETSLSVTTSRFLTLTRQPCAMVWSRAGRAVWYRTSDTLPVELPLQDLPVQSSLAGHLFSGRSRAPGMQQVDAHLWFYPRQASRIRTLLEDSVYLPSHNAVLTLLWVVGLKEDNRSREQSDRTADTMSSVP